MECRTVEGVGPWEGGLGELWEVVELLNAGSEIFPRGVARGQR